jgi:hypothetical protein
LNVDGALQSRGLGNFEEKASSLRAARFERSLPFWLSVPAFLYFAGFAFLGRPMGGIGLTTKVFLGLVCGGSVVGSHALHSSATRTVYLRSHASELLCHEFWVEQSVSGCIRFTTGLCIAGR